jgi:hypothetical protein
VQETPEVLLPQIQAGVNNSLYKIVICGEWTCIRELDIKFDIFARFCGLADSYSYIHFSGMHRCGNNTNFYSLSMNNNL